MCPYISYNYFPLREIAKYTRGIIFIFLPPSLLKGEGSNT